jgi:hypothetical protein
MPDQPQHDDFVTFHNLDASSNPVFLSTQSVHLIGSVHTEAKAQTTVLANPLSVVTYRFDAYSYNGIWRCQSSHMPSDLAEVFTWDTVNNWQTVGNNNELLFYVTPGALTLSCRTTAVLSFDINATASITFAGNNQDCAWAWNATISSGTIIGRDSYDWVSSPRVTTAFKTADVGGLWAPDSADSTIDIDVANLAGAGTASREELSLVVRLA